MDQVCCPGDRLQQQGEYAAGPGTHISDGFICASLTGVATIISASSDSQSPVVQVVRKGPEPVVPEVGAEVTVKINKVSTRLAAADILCVGNRPVTTVFSGIIRVQDVRDTEIDKVVMYSMFRPGDIVRAQVVSLGDSRSYILSTAKASLGVVSAKSPAGVAMEPISWHEMRCPQTRVVEKRKVAKVDSC